MARALMCHSNSIERKSASLLEGRKAYAKIKFLFSMNLYCPIDGYHQDEPLEIICVDPECIATNKVLNCIVCIEESHKGHQVLHYSKFVKLLQQHGLSLRNELVRELRQGEEEDTLSKCRQLIQKLNVLQALIVDQITKQREQIERKMAYIEKYLSGLPMYETFTTALKTRDQALVSKLLANFFIKVEYNSKRSDFSLRHAPLVDKSEETEGENELFRKLKDVHDIMRNTSSRVSLDLMHNYTGASFKSIYRVKSTAKIEEMTSNNYRSNQRSVERTPMSPSPLDDRASVAQSLSQYYYKPKNRGEVVGDKIPLIMAAPTSLGYTFHNEYFGEGLQVLPKQVKLTIDSDRKIALIKPPVYGCGVTREQTIKLLIKSCKNSNQRYPMAVGIGEQNKLKQENFVFSGFAEHVAGPGKSQDHGCYLLNANGHIRSPQSDMSKSNPSVRFYTNSIIEMTFKPFHKLLVINRDSTVQCSIQLDLQENQKLYFCVRLADLNDSIEIQ